MMQRMRHVALRKLGPAFLVILLLVIAGCVSAPSQQAAPPAAQRPAETPGQQPAAQAPQPAPAAKPVQLKPVTVVISFSPTYWVLPVAEEQGFFKKYGLDFKLVGVEGGPTAVQALLGGSAQIGLAGAPDLLTAAAAGAKFKILASLENQSDDTLLARGEIDSGAKLKGGKIAISKFGAISHLTAWLMADRLGLDADKDVTYVQIGNDAARAAALQSGAVDAAPVNPSSGSKLVQEFGFRALVDGQKSGISFPSSNIFAIADYVSKNPDVLKAMYKGIFDGVEWMYRPENKDEAKRILATRILKMSPQDSVIEAAYQQYVPRKKYPMPPILDPANYVKIQNFSTKFNPKMQEIKIDEYLDDSLLKAAWEEWQKAKKG